MRTTLRTMTLGRAVGTGLVVAAGLTNIGPLRDNSFLTHLATGRLILADGRVPDVDPYSFTAPEAPWVVQSWLASVVYATVEALGGLPALRVLAGLLAAAVALLGWSLLRPAEGLVPRLALGAAFLVVGAGHWSPRPLMVGVIGFGIVMVVGEGRLDARWLVPVGWLWANSHGSFPLGVLYLCLLALGVRLDRGPARPALAAAGWLVVGLGLAVLGPLGPRVLTFPVELLSQQSLLRDVVEWQSPAFTSVSDRAFLVLVVAALLALVRRPSHRRAVPAAAFTAAALLAARNIPLASLALLPLLAEGAAGLGSLRTSARRGALALAASAVVLGGLAGVMRLAGPDLQFDAYPVRSLAYLEARGVRLDEQRLAARELVGNLLTVTYGTEARVVFYDDRFDMYPAEVSRRALSFTQGGPGGMAALEWSAATLALVSRQGQMAATLARDPDWRVLLAEQEWVLTCRRGTELGGTIGWC